MSSKYAREVRQLKRGRDNASQIRKTQQDVPGGGAGQRATGSRAAATQGGAAAGTVGRGEECKETGAVRKGGLGKMVWSDRHHSGDLCAAANSLARVIQKCALGRV